MITFSIELTKSYTVVIAPFRQITNSTSVRPFMYTKRVPFVYLLHPSEAFPSYVPGTVVGETGVGGGRASVPSGTHHGNGG